MESNPTNIPPANTEQTTGQMASTTKVLGVERRLIGFGFGLFLMLAILAVLYSVFTRLPQSSAVPTDPRVALPEQLAEQPTPPLRVQDAALPAMVTPEGVATDLIDEALADRDDLAEYASDEIADVEDGSNY